VGRIRKPRNTFLGLVSARGSARAPWWASIAVAAGCAVGPDYHRPPADVPPAWQSDAPWHEATPNDGALKGDWWRLFQDDTLNPLVERALTGNQDLRVASARLDQAREQVNVPPRLAAKRRRTVRSPCIPYPVSPPCRTVLSWVPP